MALSDFQPERREVIVNGRPLFSVEGLSLETLATLVKTHLPDMEAVFDILMHGEQPGESLAQQLARIAPGIVFQAPGLAANIIAICSGEEVTEGLVAKARRLPFPAQAEALVLIGQMTFEEVGGVKKAVESLMLLMQRLRTSVATQLTEAPSTPSSATTSESAGT